MYTARNAPEKKNQTIFRCYVSKWKIMNFLCCSLKKQRMYQAKYHLIICCLTRFRSGQTKEKGCNTLRFSRQFFINLFSIHLVEWQPLLSTLNDEQWNRWTERILNDLVLKVDEMRVADKVIYQGKASQCMYMHGNVWSIRTMVQE